MQTTIRKPAAQEGSDLGGILRPEPYDPTKPFNTQIRAMIASTHPDSGPIIVRPHGKRFSASKSPELVRDALEGKAVDGVGTKGLIHFMMNTPHFAAQDAFAMVVDDLIEGGYNPVEFTDHIQIQEEDKDKIFKIIKTLVELAQSNPWTADGKDYPMIITGGETAVINTLKGLEIGIQAIGYVRKGREINSDVRHDDVLIGIESSGLHSNGYSTLREELLDARKMQLSDTLPWGKTLGEELIIPTRIYLGAIKKLLNELGKEEPANRSIRGMVHITGGGLSKLRELVDLMPESRRNVDIHVTNSHRLEPQNIFRYVHDELGVPSQRMYRSFNNGIGFVVAVRKGDEARALEVLRKHFKAEIIGSVERGRGRVLIDSKYGNETITY